MAEMLTFAARAGDLPSGKPPMKTHRKGGRRSAKGAVILNRLGHPDALWLEGRTTGWLTPIT